MMKYLKPHMVKVFLLILGVTIGIGLQLFNPQLIRYFIDAALAGKPTEVLMKAAIVFISIAFFQQLLVIFTAHLSKKIGWQATNALRKDLIVHCLELDQSFHKSLKPGELIERIDGDVTILK